MARVGFGIGSDRHSDRQRKKQHTSWKFRHKFTVEEALAGLYPYSERYANHRFYKVGVPSLFTVVKAKRLPARLMAGSIQRLES